MNTRALCVFVLTAMAMCSVILAAPPVAPPSGTYAGEGLTVVLKRDGDSYTGTVSLNGKTYPLEADFDEDEGLTGTFEVGDDDFDFNAVLKGGTLTFTTGGTVYKLAAPPAAKPANPLDKKPANPLDSRPAAQPAAGTLKLKRLAIRDPGINNIEAVSFLIPEGWKHEGGVTWMHDYSILANLLLKISDPATGAQVEYLPMQNFSWVENPPFPMQLFSNYMGNLVHPPVRDVSEFVRIMYMPQALPHLQRARPIKAERLHEVEKQYAKAVEQAPAGGQASVYSGKARYEYEREGRVWEEDVYVFLSYYTGQGMTIWSVSSAYAFRAPKEANGESGLDKVAPILTTITNTARVSQDWFSGYMYVSQLFRDRQMQGIRDATRLSRMISENAEHTRRLYAQAYAERNASQERINRSFGEYIRGVETYTNPYESREVQLPSGYSDAWVNPQGEYLLVGPGGADPNVGSTVEWKRMQTVP